MNLMWNVTTKMPLRGPHLWVWEVALLSYLSYPVPGVITGLPGPQGDINSGDWPSQVGGWVQSQRPYPAKTYCYEISDKNSRMDWLAWESQNPQRVVGVMGKKLRWVRGNSHEGFLQFKLPQKHYSQLCKSMNWHVSRRGKKCRYWILIEENVDDGTWLDQ
jgi:hypothetical protein